MLLTKILASPRIVGAGLVGWGVGSSVRLAFGWGSLFTPLSWVFPLFCISPNPLGDEPVGGGCCASALAVGVFLYESLCGRPLLFI